MSGYNRKRAISPPTDAEVATVLSRETHPRNPLIIVLAEKRGLRADEIARLQCSDLRSGERPVLDFIGKGGKRGILPLDDEMLGYIERALAVRPTDLTHDFLIWNFRNRDTGITPGEVWYIVHKAGARADVALWPHLLRHKCATDLWRQTGNALTVQAGLRHTRLSTTAHYCHPTAEDMRGAFEALDSRSWFLKMLSKIKPPIPEIFTKKPVPTFTGDTVGRSEILGTLKANLSAGIHTVLCGPRGSGKSHILSLFTGSNIYRLDDMRAPREKLVALAKQMKADDALMDEPSGQSTEAFLQSLISARKPGKYALIIDDLTYTESSGVLLLQKLKDYFTIITAVDAIQRAKVNKIFFGGRDIIDVLPLEPDEAFALADKASMDLPTTAGGREGFLNRVVDESKGSPKAIMEIIDKERRRGHVVDADTEVEHEAVQEPLPAKPIIKFVGLVCLAGRFIASRLGMPDLALILIGMAVVAGLLVLIDYLLEKAARQ